MACSSCGQAGRCCDCIINAGTNTTVTGHGTRADPFVISSSESGAPGPAGAPGATGPPGPAMTCEAVVDCVDAALGDGLGHDETTEKIFARLSTDAGQVMSFGTDRGLLVLDSDTGGGGTCPDDTEFL